MGITIHFDIKTSTIDNTEALRLIKEMHRLAKKHKFLEVLDIVHTVGNKCRAIDKKINLSEYYDLKWLNHLAKAKNERGIRTFPANEFYYFEIDVAEGSETLKIGLATTETGNNREWYWSGFCKTHYAAEVSLMNFLLAHTQVINFFRSLNQMGKGKITLDINDEGEYWEKKFIPTLIKYITSQKFTTTELFEIIAQFE